MVPVECAPQLFTQQALGKPLLWAWSGPCPRKSQGRPDSRREGEWATHLVFQMSSGAHTVSAQEIQRQKSRKASWRKQDLA